MQRSVIVLPQPLGPRSVAVLPASRWKSTAATPTTAPYRFTKPLTSTDTAPTYLLSLLALCAGSGLVTSCSIAFLPFLLQDRPCNLRGPRALRLPPHARQPTGKASSKDRARSRFPTPCRY